MFGTAICWKSSLQYVVALSTTEVEYITLCDAAKEVVWLKGLLSEFDIMQNTIRISCDNQSTIYLSKHPIFHDRSKHINVKLYYIKNVNKGIVQIVKVKYKDNAANILTKAINSLKLLHCLDLINISSIDNTTKKDM